MIICDIFSLPISTFLLFSQVGKPILDKTVPTHIAELQRLQEACGGLGVDVTDAQFSGVITL